MLTYCLKCRKNTKNIDSKMVKTKNGRSVCCLWKSRKSINEQFRN